MRGLKLLVLAATTLAAFGVVPSHADDFLCGANQGSKDAPQFTDVSDDALLAGTQAPDSTDLISGWFQQESDGSFTMHITVATLSGAETNNVVYVYFDYQGTDPILKKRRFVSIQARPTIPPDSGAAYGPAVRYGYLDTTGAVGSNVGEGYTAGSVVAGTPGELSIKVPFDKLGNPPSGATLGNVVIDSRVLIGPPGHGHPEINPTAASGSGVVEQVDLADGDGCGDITMP